MKQSLTRKILIYLILIICFNIAVLLATNYFSISTAQKEMKQSYMNSLQLFTGDINMELKNISNFLTSFVNQTETRKFCYLDEDMYFIKNRLQGSMYNALYSD